MYFNVFISRKRPGYDADAYTADAVRMEALARAQSGFVSFRRYMGENGEGLSISEWESEADARAWARHPEHAAMQARARLEYYESYEVYSCVDPQVRRFGKSGPAQP